MVLCLVFVLTLSGPAILGMRKANVHAASLSQSAIGTLSQTRSEDKYASALVPDPAASAVPAHDVQKRHCLFRRQAVFTHPVSVLHGYIHVAKLGSGIDDAFLTKL